MNMAQRLTAARPDVLQGTRTGASLLWSWAKSCTLMVRQRLPRSFERYAMNDPIVTNPDLYRVLFENERVRVLEYLDQPGDATQPHSHPDSVMVTLSAFRRRLRSRNNEVDVELPAFHARWLDAQEHSGTNIGSTPSHTIFVELKEPRASDSAAGRLGPSTS